VADCKLYHKENAALLSHVKHLAVVPSTIALEKWLIKNVIMEINGCELMIIINSK